jgi:drug/metabolite transporter (DMT)-like permease
VVLAVVNFFWAAQYPAYKVAADAMEPAALNFWTLAVASLLLAPFWLRERARRSAPRSRRRLRTAGEYVVLGVLGIIPPSVLLAWGIGHSSAANAAILSLTIPVMMTVLGVVMLGERLTGIRIVCLALGLAGTLLISTRDLEHASFSRGLLTGNLIILVAGLGSAFYNTYSKNLLAHYSELEVLVYSYAVAGVACAVISWLVDRRPFFMVSGYAAATWGAVVTLGVLPWGIAMILWMWVLNRLEVGQASASIYLLPVFGLLLSVVSLHEPIALQQALGGALTLIGAAILTVYERDPATAPAAR